MELVAFTNFDYDKDHLETGEELKLGCEAGLSGVTPVDPTVPDAWGFFERGDDSGFNANGHPFEFDLFVPAGNPLGNYLYLNVEDGTVSGLMVDDDTLTFARQSFAAGSHFLANLAPGYHKIIGQASGDYYSIDFRLNLAKVRGEAVEVDPGLLRVPEHLFVPVRPRPVPEDVRGPLPRGLFEPAQVPNRGDLVERVLERDHGLFGLGVPRHEDVDFLLVAPHLDANGGLHPLLGEDFLHNGFQPRRDLVLAPEVIAEFFQEAGAYRGPPCRLLGLARGHALGPGHDPAVFQK